MPPKHPFPSGKASGLSPTNAFGGTRQRRTRSSPAAPRSDEQQAQLDSIRQRMLAISRPNGEPRRSLIDILDDAIGLEDDYQRRSNSSQQSNNLNNSASSHLDDSTQDNSPDESQEKPDKSKQ